MGMGERLLLIRERLKTCNWLSRWNSGGRYAGSIGAHASRSAWLRTAEADRSGRNEEHLSSPDVDGSR